MNESSKRVIYKRLLTPEEALSLLKKHYRLEPLGVEEVDLEEAAGRVLAETIISPIDIPPFSRSRMDGYAVRAEDTFGASYSSPVTLRLGGVVEAGSRPDVKVETGVAVEVATGAPIPPGANAVVMIEHTKREDQTIQIHKPVTPGENVEPAGADVSRGEPIAFKGTVLTPQIVGAIAACGVRKVKVYRKVKVGIISTGVELQRPGEALEGYKVYDVNTYSLHAALQEVGCQPVIYGIVRDEEEELKKTLERAIRECDVILTSGSTSAGLNDMAYRILRGMGEPGVIVEGLNIKPGKRTIIAVIEGKLIFGLPGFPVSALMVFTHMVKPVLARLSGRTLRLSAVKAKLAEAVQGGSRRVYQPVVLVEGEDGRYAYPVWGESSSIVRMSSSDGFIVVPENFEGYEEGDYTEVYLFSEHMVKPDVYLFAYPDPTVYMLSEAAEQHLKIKTIASTTDRIIAAVERRHAHVVALPTRIESREHTLTVKAHSKLKSMGYAVIASFRREFGVAHLKDKLDEGGEALRLASSPREWDQLEMAASIIGTGKVRKIRVRTLAEAKSLLEQNVVDGIVTTRFNAEKLNLKFTPIGWDIFDFMALTDKIGREIMELLKDKLSRLGGIAREKLPGYSPA